MSSYGSQKHGTALHDSWVSIYITYTIFVGIDIINLYDVYDILDTGIRASKKEGGN